MTNSTAAVARVSSLERRLRRAEDLFWESLNRKIRIGRYLTVRGVCSMLQAALKVGNRQLHAESLNQRFGPLGRTLNVLFKYFCDVTRWGTRRAPMRTFEGVLSEYLVTGGLLGYSPWGTQPGLSAPDKERVTALLRETISRPWTNSQDVACAFGAAVFLVRLVDSRAAADQLLEFFLSQTDRAECRRTSGQPIEGMQPRLEMPSTSGYYPAAFALLEPARQLILCYPELLNEARVKRMVDVSRRSKLTGMLSSIIGKLSPQQLPYGVELVQSIWDFCLHVGCGGRDYNARDGVSVTLVLSDLLAKSLGGGALQYYGFLLARPRFHRTWMAKRVLYGLFDYLEKSFRALREAARASSEVRTMLSEIRQALIAGRKGFLSKRVGVNKQALDRIEELLNLALGIPDPLVAELCAWASSAKNE